MEEIEMNMYKPLKRYSFNPLAEVTTRGDTFKYGNKEVEELEEKYKELLVFIDHIKECIDTDTWGLEAIDEILECHLRSED